MNWKGLAANFLVLWFLPGAATIWTLLRLRTSWPREWSETRWRWFCAGGFVLSRVVYAALLYFVLHATAGGDVRYFYEHSEPVLHGQVLGRDTENFYAPLLPYLHAFGVTVFPGRHFLGIMVAPFLSEILILFAAAELGEAMSGTAGKRWVVAWLVATPLLWQQTVLRGGEEPIFAATLALGVLLLHRRRPLAGGLALGFGFCATKISFGPYVLAVLLAQFAWDRRAGLRAAGGFVLMVAAVFIPYAASGADYLDFLKYTGNHLWGINLSEVAGGLLPGSRGPCIRIVYGGTMVLTCLWVGMRRRDAGPLEHFVSAVKLVQSVCMLVQPYVTANYVCQSLPFALLVLFRHRERRVAQVLLVLLPVLGFFVAVTADTTNALYQWVATPLSLVFHGTVLVLVLGDLRGWPGTGGAEAAAVSAGGAPA